MLLHVVCMCEYRLVCIDAALPPHLVILITLLTFDVEEVADDTLPSFKCLLLSFHKLLLLFLDKILVHIFGLGCLDESQLQIL